MSEGGALGKCSRIRHIVRLRQMLRRWRAKAARAAAAAAASGNLSGKIPADVPAGHVAVCVGTNSRRFVVRATQLNHPVFKKLLLEAEEEYGFANSGPLAIPCDESIFEEILRFASLDDFKRCAGNPEFWPESRPLLHGLSEKPIW
ncbi:hypothetical protein AAC387_Pa01g0993 [Persea americana]